MLGYILLFTAIIFYGDKRLRFLSIFLYVSFMLGTQGGGLCLWTDQVIGVKNVDLSIIYTFCINIYLLFVNQWRLPKARWTITYKALLFFVACCALFSFFHYHFTPYQILQGSRIFLLLFSLPIFMRLSYNDFCKVMTLLLWVTVLTSALYILQIVVGHPIMPYRYEYRYDEATGLVRLYNIPPLLGFFLIYSFVRPQFFKGPVNLYRILFFVSVMCTLGRTYIFSTILSVILAVMLNGKVTRILMTTFIIGILFFPFIGMIEQRFKSGGTQSDLKALQRGSYEDYQGEGSMSYRFAWIYERYDYLKDRPLGEKIFGLGFISGSQPIVYRMYDFKVGLVDEDGNVSQLHTPDTSYGNLLSKLGFIGGVIYLIFVLSLLFFFFRFRKKSPLFASCAASLLLLILTGFSGSDLSEPRNFAIYFLALSTLSLNTLVYKQSGISRSKC